MKKCATYNMLYWVKTHTPAPVLRLYHFILAKLAVFSYGNPSRKLIVIGVTGTNGKSSTVQFIAQLLTNLGHKVGYTTTAGFSIAGNEIENKMKMTMPGRFYLQQLLRDMVRAGCAYAIVETSSQGIIQYRHLGVNYDLAVFTNLTPEHIEAHGGFEAYKRAKGVLFSHLTARPHKKINGIDIPKVIVANSDDDHAQYYLDFTADKKVTFGWQEHSSPDYLFARYLERSPTKTVISINGETFVSKLHAGFQDKNALSAIATVYALGVPIKKCVQVAADLKPIAGRFEIIDSGQPFTVVVDYAYEPYALKALLSDIRALKPKRIIGVHGSAGGGRDVARRFEIGKMAGKEEDIVVVTNEDPYDEDPNIIIKQVAEGALAAGKREGHDLFMVDDRMEGIFEAISLAEEGDAVILTGKGSEPVIAVAKGRKLPWSDKEAALLALKRLGYTK